MQLLNNPLKLELYKFRIRDDSKRYVLHHFEIVFFHQHCYWQEFFVQIENTEYINFYNVNVWDNIYREL